uniref:Fe2OG dioxygenase domain-containing protein n=1 Tax=Rhizophora mucronata TaxID=61149 RepID=A0A2P2MPC6_RHIMU
MSSLSPQKLPVVNFSLENFKPGTTSWLTTTKKVIDALETYGCFIAVYDKISLELHNSLFNSLGELFDLPLEIKQKNISELPYFGYLGSEKTHRPLYESLGIGAANTPEATQDFTNALWPQGNENFCSNLLSYAKLAAELDQMVLRMVFESYGLDDQHYKSRKDCTVYLFRMMKYGVPKNNDPGLGSNIHTDKNFVTILDQNQVKGLEVKTKEGHWIGVEPSVSSFTVMAGEAFTVWSNGRIHAPLHRVGMRGKEERFSVGLFSYQRGTIQVPKELIDEEHPLRFKPFDHFEFMRYFASHPNLPVASTLEAYCAI